MKINKNIKSRVKNLQNITSTDLMRYELYAILTTLILSKEEFKANKDINDFLNLLGINFKEYVFNTRTLVIARTLKIVQKADTESLQLYIRVLQEEYLTDGKNNKDSKITNKKKSTDNYMGKILNKYSRNKR